MKSIKKICTGRCYVNGTLLPLIVFTCKLRHYALFSVNRCHCFGEEITSSFQMSVIMYLLHLLSSFRDICAKVRDILRGIGRHSSHDMKWLVTLRKWKVRYFKLNLSLPSFYFLKNYNERIHKVLTHQSSELRLHTSWSIEFSFFTIKGVPSFLALILSNFPLIFSPHWSMK